LNYARSDWNCRRISLQNYARNNTKASRHAGIAKRYLISS